MGGDAMGPARLVKVASRRAWRVAEELRSRVEKPLYEHGVLRPDPRRLPEFLGIGLRKSGTTWLYETLRAHPQVDAGQRKSHHYFDESFHQTFSSYLAHFAPAREGVVRGEVTTGYALMSERRIGFLRRVMPDVRLILLIRNPVEREWSLVVHHAIKHGLPLEGLDDDFVIPFFERSEVLRAGGYSAVVERWRRIFPPEQVFVGLYDDIADRPKRLLERIYCHVGITTRVDWDAIPYRQVIVPPNGPQYRDHDKDRGAVAIGHTNSARRLPARYRHLLSDMYREDIERLADILGEDLARWSPGPERGGESAQGDSEGGQATPYDGQELDRAGRVRPRQPPA